MTPPFKIIKLPNSSYLEISHIKTPLPVTSALDTVTDFPVYVLTTVVPAEFQSFHV